MLLVGGGMAVQGKTTSIAIPSAYTASRGMGAGSSKHVLWGGPPWLVAATRPAHKHHPHQPVPG
eukprot:6323407-Alexandrium_andersonii.AAC.1